MAIGLGEAMLISLMMESLLFGVFTLLFALTMYILFMRRKHGQRVNKSIVAISAAMYILAVMHIGVNTQRVISGFIGSSGKPGGSDAYFNDVSNPLYIFKSAIYQIQTFLGDGFVIYRLYVVWNGDKRVVVPALVCFLGCLITGFGALVSITLVSSTSSVFITSLKHWITSIFAMTLVTNSGCTALIAYQIWRTSQQTRAAVSYFSDSLSPVLVVIVESGIIYSANVVSLLATYQSGSWGQYPLLESTTSLIGVVFSLIIVRIGLGVSPNETTRNTTLATHDNSRGVNFSQKRSGQAIPVQITRTQIARNDYGEPIRLSSVVSTASNTVHHDSKVNVIEIESGEVSV